MEAAATVSTRVATIATKCTRVAIPISEWASRAIWAICVRSELLGKLLLLGDSILNSLLLSSNIVPVLLLLSSHELFVLLLLSLHELLALGLGLDESLLLSLTDLLDLLSGHTVWAIWVSATVVWGRIREEGHFETGCCSPH